jgi:hypothetical protein
VIEIDALTTTLSLFMCIGIDAKKIDIILKGSATMIHIKQEL